MIIYEANETDFFNNGLGTLPDATSALVTEERNGEFVLDVIYPQQGLRSELLTKNRIIKADAGHELKDQRFVIKKVTPTMDSDGYIYLTVHAEHVSYITADLGVTPNLTLSGNATQALEQWQANLVGGHPDITVDSDIVSTHETNLDITKATNARQVLGGVEGSILDTWGGEYKFDNLHISLRGQRGTTANTLISYGRNLLTFEQEDDITDTYTSIYPYANVGLANGNNSKLVTVDGYFVDSQYVDRYPNRKLLPVDFGSEFTDYKIGSKPSESDTGIYTTEAEIKKKLVELAKQYIENNRVGIPKASTKITFADLSKTSEYAPLEQVNLCDIIPIRFEKLGIDTTIKVTRVVWNVLLDEYDSIELGDLRTTLGESISALESKTIGLANAVITAQSTADNQNSIFRTNGSTAEPVAKKTGDLWFKTDGDYQYMYQWDGAVWHEVVNTKTTDDIAKEVDKARVKMEELVKKANDDTTIFRTEGQEAAPTAKKKGDLWFKTDGDYQYMYQWDGQKWHEIVSTKTTEDITKQVEQAQADLVQVRADANRISETQTESAKRLDEQMQELQAKTSDNATNVQNVIRDVAQAHADYVAQQADLSKQKADLEKAKQSLQTTSQGLDQARQDLLSNSVRLNKLEVGVDGVTVNVNNLNTKVDNIKIGGTNLIRNGGNPKTTDGWPLGGMSNDRKLIVWSHGFWKNGKENLFALFNRDSNEVYMCSNRVKVERNTEYTLSYWAFEDWRVISSDTFFLGRRNDETSDFTKIVGLVNSRVYSGAKAEYVTVTFNTGDCDEGYIRFDNNGSKEVGKDAVLFLANIKLEKGNRATDYSPAPEDLIEKVVQFKVDLDGIRGTVANAQGDIAQIKLTENGMQQNIKDAQGNISSLQNDAKGFKQQFSDVNGNIATIKRNATELSEQLASKVGNTEYQSFKTQTAKELSEKLVRTDLNGYVTTAEVKLTADGLKEQYNSVNSKVNNLKIGGVNLIDNGGNPQTTDGWAVNGTSGDKFLRVGTHPLWKNSQEKLFILYNSDRLYEATMSSNRVKVERNTDYTLSYWAFNDGHVVDTDTLFLGRKNGETSDFTKIFNLISKRKYSTSKAEYVTVTFNTGEADEGYIRFDNNRTYDTQCALYLANIQLEKGNVATDYGPSANDVANAISGVSKDLTNYKAVVERDYAKNSSVYTKNEVVNLTNNSKDSAVNAIKNDTNWKGLVNINANSAFLQTADGFESEVVKKATPLVEGGGVNLVPSSGKPTDTAHAGWYGVAVSPHLFWKKGKENVFVINNSDTKYEKSASSDWITVERGETYTISFWACMSGNCSDYDLYFLGRKKGETADFTQIRRVVATRRVSGAMFEYKKFTFNVGQSDEGYLRFDNNRSTDGNNSIFLFTYVKMEKGTVATPWTPAPEDLATVVSVNKVIDTADSHTQIIKDYLTNDNSQFKILKDSVSQKVQKGDVIGQINLEAGKTLIQNQKVYLDADTVAFSNKAFIPSAAITDLDAGKITTGTLNAAKLNVINLNANAINAGTLSGAYLHITKDSYIDNASIDGAKIKSLDAGKITTGTLNAANVKVINLDANNIKSGTISGNNLSLNLDNGTVSFKKGKIVSSNNKLILNIDDGSLAVGDASQRQGMMFNQGKMYMYDQGYFGNSTWNGNVYDWMLEMKKHPYAVLEYSSSFSGTSGSIFGGSGANFHSTSGVAIAYDKNVSQTASAGNVSGIFDDWNPMNGHGVFVNENGIAMGAEDKLVSIVGGTSFRYGQQSIWNFKPTILVGTNLWTDNVYDHGYNVNKMISDGPNIYMQASALITDTSAAIFNVENGDVEFAIKGSDKNVVINASGHTSNGLVVKGSQNITNWLGCQDLSVRGNKNSVVQTSQGWTKINAYETAEYYFGDLGTAVTDDTSTVRIGIEPLFNETVNTNIPYQVFVTAYGEGYAWVAERGSNYFVIKSSVPNLEIGYEIKAKRKGYENVRLEIDKHMEVNKQ